MSKYLAELAGKRIVVTGGVGSVGREIAAKLAQSSAAQVRVIDNNESALFDMEMEFSGRNGGPEFDFFHCDITDEREMRRTFAGMDLCFHCAALKHVPSCERSPFSAVKINVEGVEVVGRVAQTQGLQKVIFTSSDKAVNPTNVMGTSKLMGERMFTAMNFLTSSLSPTAFSSTRFGNVLGSRGSVVPVFAKQIAVGGPVRVTDERMTRFVMTMSEAADLVIDSMVLAVGGEVFITKMPVLKIVDLARVMIDRIAPLYGHDPKAIDIAITGSRPGEKLWEELSTDEEANRLLESDRFLIVTPAGHTPEQRKLKYRFDRIHVKPSKVIYHSDREKVMADDEIWKLLTQEGVLPEDVTKRLNSK